MSPLPTLMLCHDCGQVAHDELQHRRWHEDQHRISHPTMQPISRDDLLARLTAPKPTGDAE